MIGIATGTGVGVSTMLSRALGSRDNKLANRVAGNSLFLCVCCWIIMAIFGIFFADAFIHSQTDIESIRSYGDSYLRIVTIGSVFVYFEINFERLLQSTGQTKLSMWAQIIGAVANIILDPFFIYGWCGLPQMGVRGAAVATVVGQLVSLALGLAFHLKLNVELDSSLRYWKPRWDVIRSIYAIGLPAIISQALLTVMTYSLNLILAVMPDVGQNAVTVYGLYYKIQQLIIFAAFGVRDAITPVVAFNYGLRSRARVQQGIRWGLGYTAGLMLLGCAGVELFAQPLAGLFSLSATTHAMCVDCMRIVSLGFLFAGLCIAFQGVFQALECGVESLVISLCRQVLFVLPPVWALTRLVTGPENVSLVWWPLALGEAATLVVALVLYQKRAKKRIDF